MIKTITVLMCILCTSFILSAQKYANEFLSLGIGARAYAMGNAVVASSNSTTSGFYNPAGLMTLEGKSQASIMHAELYAGAVRHDYGSFSMPVSDGNRYLGFSVIRTGVDDIPYTLNLLDPNGNIQSDNISFFSAADYALYVSYAQGLHNVLDGLDVGASAKIIYRTVGKFSTAYGFGIDIGAQYELPKFTLGLQLKDITTTFSAWSFDFSEEEKEILALTNNEIPESSTEFAYPKINLGIASKIIENSNMSLLLELDLDINTDGQRNVLLNFIDPHFGAEFELNNIVFVRAGINNMQNASNSLGEEVFSVQPNAGVGFKVADLSIDYALSRFGDSQTDNANVFSHIISLSFDINN